MAEATLHAFDTANVHEAALTISVRRRLETRAGRVTAVVSKGRAGKLVVAVMIIAGAGTTTDQIVAAVIAIPQSDGAIQADGIGAEFAVYTSAGELWGGTLDTPDYMFFLDRGAAIRLDRSSEFGCWLVLAW